MKKFLAIVLALVMLFALGTTAFAAGEGTITVNGTAGQTYKAYRIFDLESYDKDAGHYSYTVNTAWKDFDMSAYVDITNGYVTWKDGADAAAFAQAALAYAKEKGIAAVKTETAGTDGKVTFTGLDLGYYLIDSSLGALCMLDTTNPTATINEKNEGPEIDKTENKTTASIGEKVDYTVNIKVKAGAENYVMHDKMTAGLTFNNDITVTVDGTAVAASANTYTVTAPGADGCTFDIAFADSYVKGLSGKTIVVKYSATVNENAITETAKNDAKLAYGDNNETTSSTVEVKNHGFDIVKTNVDNEILQGAKFILLDSSKTEIKLVKENGYYRPAKTGETPVDYIEAGNVTIKGLADGTYYLRETEAPAGGYNKLASDVTVTIAGEDNSATITDGKYVSGGVEVENRTGSELPGTGGMGTTMFYVIGAVLMLGAAVVLITKKKVSAK